MTIHNLTEAQEQALFAAIAAIIFPGRKMALPATTRKAPPSGSRKLSPPLQDLVNEHTNIKRVLALLPSLAAALRDGLTPERRTEITRVIEFIRNYADQFHHAKEEDILFKCFDTESDILKVMLTDHENGRHHVRSAIAALEQGNASGVIEALAAYGTLLHEHIKKEDEILYPWMNSQLTDSQVGQLFTAFRTVDAKFEAGVTVHLGRVDELEKRYSPQRSSAQ